MTSIDNYFGLVSEEMINKLKEVFKNFNIDISDNFEGRVTEIVNAQKDKKIVEFSTDYTINVPERLLKQLYNINFNSLKSMGSNITMNYYNEQNVYIVQKD